MIDEKKINEAARGYCDATYGTLKEEPFIAEGFRQGARWAQQEFINSLWHDASEEPKDYNEWIIFRCDDFDYVGTHLARDYGDWGSMAEIWESFHWCYLSDILPKEGGEV